MIGACHLSGGGLAEAGGARRHHAAPGQPPGRLAAVRHGPDAVPERARRPIAGPAGFLQQKTGRPRDATRGFINIAQAAIITIFSVVAVIFLPPTPSASIHGMTFAVMPELGWRFGYPAALAPVAAAAVGACVILRRKEWV